MDEDHQETNSLEDQIAFPVQGERERPLILIADDDPEILRLLDFFFKEKDCDIIEVEDGALALEQIIDHNPDLMLLDVMMPHLNGWEVCKYLKSHPEYDKMGIIILTAIGPITNELTSPIFGADDYIDKPFDFEELELKMRKVLAKNHGIEVEGSEPPPLEEFKNYARHKPGVQE